MKQKTSLQQLKEKIEFQKVFYGTRFPQFILWIDEFLEIEKQQIINAFDSGFSDGTNYDMTCGDYYYKKTYTD